MRMKSRKRESPKTNYTHYKEAKRKKVNFNDFLGCFKLFFSLFLGRIYVGNFAWPFLFHSFRVSVCVCVCFATATIESSSAFFPAPLSPDTRDCVEPNRSRKKLAKRRRYFDFHARAMKRKKNEYKERKRRTHL